MSHDIIVERLNHDFPGVPQILEEQTNGELPRRPYLVGDELDGTAVFAAGTADWGVTLAMMEGAPTHGVIYLPMRDILIVAEKGAGCWLNGVPVKLHSSKVLRNSIFSTELNPRLQPAQRRFNDLLIDASLTTRCMGSSTASIAELLLRHTDLYLNCGGGKIWDFAAGALAVEEAGGVSHCADGAEIPWDRLPMDILFSSTAALAQEAIALRPCV
jgi:fructose-1,6-bisphosphatase/inositol monophosphatase family enzyme